MHNHPSGDQTDLSCRQTLTETKLGSRGWGEPIHNGCLKETRVARFNSVMGFRQSRWCRKCPSHNNVSYLQNQSMLQNLQERGIHSPLWNWESPQANPNYPAFHHYCSACVHQLLAKQLADCLCWRRLDVWQVLSKLSVKLICTPTFLGNLVCNFWYLSESAELWLQSLLLHQ
jgi:hypothetical protein